MVCRVLLLTGSGPGELQPLREKHMEMLLALRRVRVKTSVSVMAVPAVRGGSAYPHFQICERGWGLSTVLSAALDTFMGGIISQNYRV